MHSCRTVSARAPRRQPVSSIGIGNLRSASSNLKRGIFAPAFKSLQLLPTDILVRRKRLKTNQTEKTCSTLYCSTSGYHQDYSPFVRWKRSSPDRDLSGWNFRGIGTMHKATLDHTRYEGGQALGTQPPHSDETAAKRRRYPELQPEYPKEGANLLRLRLVVTVTHIWSYRWSGLAVEAIDGSTYTCRGSKTPQPPVDPTATSPLRSLS